MKHYRDIKIGKLYWFNAISDSSLDLRDFETSNVVGSINHGDMFMTLAINNIKRDHSIKVGAACWEDLYDIKVLTTNGIVGTMRLYDFFEGDLVMEEVAKQ